MKMDSYFLLYLCSVTMAAFSQVLLKKGAQKQYAVFWREYLNVYVVSGYGLTGLSMLLTILAFRGMEYKYGPVIESLGYVLVVLLSRFFFSERITARKAVGTLFILGGILMFNL